MATTLAVAVPPPPFLLSIELPAGRITVHGELDREQVHRLAEAVGVLLMSPSRSWSIDVSALTFCDVAGLRGICQAQRLAADSGRRLLVTGPSSLLRRLLHLAGASTPDVAEASSRWSPPPHRRCRSSSAATCL